jgi:hypothetical protein
LRELQSQGVQVTREVQLSARKVVADNARLKALLRYVGVDDQVIETWTPDDVDQSLPALSECDKKAGKCIRKVSLSLDLIPGFQLLKPKDGQNDVTSSGPPILRIEPTALQAEHALPPAKVCQAECSAQKVNTTEECENTDKDKPITLALPPCKVLTRLAEDPSADVTQPIAAGDNTDEQENGGVECSKAHAMLMQFATTEEKLEVISQALERGCVGKKGGGCKVRNEAMWKAMDDIID